MILFGHIDMVMFILADVMPFNVWISLIDVIIKVCVEDVIPHIGRCYCHVRWYYHTCWICVVIFCIWQMLLPFYISGRCYCQIVLLVVDGKTTCFVSSIMADVLPWWLMLLPLSCKIIYDGWCYCHGSCCYCYFFLWLMLLPQWLMLLPLGTFVLADVIAMVADVITTQGDWGALADVKANCGWCYYHGKTSAIILDTKQVVLPSTTNKTIWQ